MPFTPFHFGAGALVHSVAPKHVSFLAFCGANALVDVESLYFMLTHQYPIHRFFHTYVGATIAAAVVIAAFSLAHGIAPRLLDALGLRRLSVRAVAFGALAGTYSPAATSNSPTRGQVKIPHLTAAGAVGVYAV